ncbi:DUF4139 domain-containing protein [Crocinitomix catalasitica]|uniref:DUF4139 domain-containing protein n=1 Tax=Crocinitomix catalasitica TaxID=184607 RepID=UPI0009FCE9C1|nr:DUF4139 domain-containing protein [Crocinitomix catalasitica]
MKIEKFIVLSFILISPFFVRATNVVELKTKVNKATVFTEGAQLSRVQKISLKKGENTIRFTELEKDVNLNSIQLFGLNGNDNISVVYTRFTHEAKVQPTVIKLIAVMQDSLDDLTRKISLRSNEIQNLQGEKNLILAHKDVGLKTEETMVNRLSTLTKFYRLSTNEIDELIYDLQVEVNEFNGIKNAVQSRFNRQVAKKMMGVVEAKIYAVKDISMSFELNYLVTNVNWMPFYEIKSAGLSSPLKVVCKATINLNTGVDWDNVEMVLSTRKPEVLCRVPEVHPWVLHFQESHQKFAQQDQFVNNQAISNSYIPLDAPMNVYEPAVSSSSTSAYLSRFKNAAHKMINKEFEDDIPYTIGGENGIAVMVLDEFDMQADYMYYAVPKYDQHVYLVAEIAEWEQHDLIPAYANIFLEGSYAGKLFIDPTSIDEKLTLMLGKDPDILVERKKVDQFDEKQLNLLGSTSTTEISIEINVKSKRKNDIKLVLKDQVPISNNEEIEVNIKNISKADKDDKTGVLTWTYDLKALSTVQHKIQYEVKKPKNKKIYNF